MSKHTPGPWRLKDLPSHGFEIVAVVKDFRGEPLARLFDVPGDKDVHFFLNHEGELEAMLSFESYYQFPPDTFRVAQLANARLIAAAPKLMEALEELVGAASMVQDQLDIAVADDFGMDKALGLAHQALDSARDG